MVGLRTMAVAAAFVLFLPTAGASTYTQVRGIGVLGAAEFGSAMARDGDWLAVAAQSNFVGSAQAGSVFVFRLVAGQWLQVQRLDPDSTDEAKRFGSDVALKNGLLVVGSSWDSEGGVAAGAAYVYRLGAFGFELEQKLYAPAPAGGNFFGESVATDGTDVFATSWGNPAWHGAIHVFSKRVTWTQVQQLSAGSGEWYEGDLEVDGKTLVLGSMYDNSLARRGGAVYVFTHGTTWTRAQKITPSDLRPHDNFGMGVAIKGGVLVAGAPGRDDVASNAGAVYIYKPGQNGWVLDQKLLGSSASEMFGFHTATDGTDVLASAPWRDLGEVDRFTKAAAWGSSATYQGEGLSQEVGTSLVLTDQVLIGAPLDLAGGVVHRYG
jgi:hypothetical protein